MTGRFGTGAVAMGFLLVSCYLVSFRVDSWLILDF